MNFGHMNFLFSLSGFGVGTVVGLTGVGGGSLMTPLLVLLFGIHPATAVGTDLLYAAATKSVGTVVHGRNSSVDWRIVRRLATGSVPATALTFLAMNSMGIQSSKGGPLAFLLGAVLLLTAITLLFRQQIVSYLSVRMTAENDSVARRNYGFGSECRSIHKITAEHICSRSDYRIRISYRIAISRVEA